MKRLSAWFAAVAVVTLAIVAMSSPAREVMAQVVNTVRVENFDDLIALFPSALVGGRLDVNVGAIGNAAPSEEITFDFDTGGGTSTRGAIGLAVPASGGAAVIGGNSTEGLLVEISNPCASGDVTNVAISTATSGNVELVAISGSTVPYVCGFNVTGAADVSVQLITGTGTACGTSETDETGLYSLTTGAAGLRGINLGFAGGVVAKGDAGDAVCIELSGSVQVDGVLTYISR